ncbi:unnamed protein product [Amoebophrya sp. A120]|nr:unnamed protein product [Amoebophrya sp. A120]|eukprot:GSA120T00018303001.1
MGADPVNDFVAANSECFEFVRDGAKVRCTLTGQDFPPRMELLEEYCKSKSYNRALKAKNGGKEHQNKDTSTAKSKDTTTATSSTSGDLNSQRKLDLSFDYKKYEPHITAHKKDKTKLFCNLTASVLNKIPIEVEKHVNGKRFKRAKKEFEEMLENDVEVTDCFAEVNTTEPAAKRQKVDPATANKKETLLPPLDDEADDEKRAAKPAEEASPSTAAEEEKPKTAAVEKKDSAKKPTSNKQEQANLNSSKLNKKQKAKLAAAETAEEKEKREQKEAIDKANAPGKKEKSCRQKRKINSKTRRKKQGKPAPAKATA